jgi:hypothetical protein
VAGARRRLAARASPRWRTVLPWSSAAPCSVTITSTWCLGVVMTVPASNQGTMRERSSSPIVTVEGMQRIERSSSWSADPDTKSSWPPMPEYCTPPMVSATTCPWMSTAMAALMVTMAWLRLMASGELTRATGRKATSWFSWSQSYSSRVPAANVHTDTPS